VEQELFTLPEHLGSSSCFSGDRISQSLAFCVVLCKSMFVLLYFFFWNTASDFPFGIFDNDNNISNKILLECDRNNFIFGFLV
jgi:hypothetical protein